MDGENTTNNGWSEWRKHVLLEIERINGNLEKLSERHSAVCLEVAKLRAYAAIWGAIGGGVITLVVAIIMSRG
jgi:hypothetical protein